MKISYNTRLNSKKHRLVMVTIIHGEGFLHILMIKVQKDERSKLFINITNKQ